MANPDSNLPTALRNDFLPVPTDAELADLELPDNTFLPYADQVTDDNLYSVTTRTVQSNPLTQEVPDTPAPRDGGREERI